MIDVRRLLSVGLSVADIQQFGVCLASSDLGSSPCPPAIEVYERRLRTLDDQIAALTQLRSALAAQAEQLRTRGQPLHGHERGVSVEACRRPW